MRLRRLTPPLRYAVYVAGVLLVFLATLGLGAAAALVAGWQSERTQTGYGGSTGFQALEDTASPETTGTDAFEGTAIEGTGKAESSNLKEPTEEASFVHRATDENSRGDYTYLGDPSIDGDPNAVVLVTVSADREGNGEAAYGHNVGVWYDSADQERWAIFNQDRTSVPSGTTFRVVLPPSSESFVHRAVLDNTVENATYLNNPLISGKADAPVSVTQSWYPGGGAGSTTTTPWGSSTTRTCRSGLSTTGTARRCPRERPSTSPSMGASKARGSQAANRHAVAQFL
jgi:hypothetical protein